MTADMMAAIPRRVTVYMIGSELKNEPEAAADKLRDDEVGVAEECPELEMLAAYVDHNLMAREQRLIEAHLLVCKRCRQTVVQTFRMKAAIADPPLPKSPADSDES